MRRNQPAACPTMHGNIYKQHLHYNAQQQTAWLGYRVAIQVTAADRDASGDWSYKYSYMGSGHFWNAVFYNYSRIYRNVEMETNVNDNVSII